MNWMYLKVLGGTGAGAAGITGIYYAIKSPMNSMASDAGDVGEISQDSSNEKLTIRAKENQKNNERMGTNAQRFIDDHELSKKQEADILRLLEEKLKITLSSTGTLKNHLESYISGAMENFCSDTESNNQDPLFKKYC